MKRFLLLFFMPAGIYAGAYAQTAPITQTNVSKQQQAIDALKGTYEIRPRTETRMQPMLPSNLAEIIETNRKENEDVIVHANDMVDVVIYPKSRILTLTK